MVNAYIAPAERTRDTSGPGKNHIPTLDWESQRVVLLLTFLGLTMQWIM